MEEGEGYISKWIEIIDAIEAITEGECNIGSTRRRGLLQMNSCVRLLIFHKNI